MIFPDETLDSEYESFENRPKVPPSFKKQLEGYIWGSKFDKSMKNANKDFIPHLLLFRILHLNILHLLLILACGHFSSSEIAEMLLTVRSFIKLANPLLNRHKLKYIC